MFKDPTTLTEAERQSQAFFNTPKRIKGIQDAQYAHTKMTEEEKEAEVDSLRQKMGMLPKAVSMAMKKRGKPKSPYEADRNEETDLTKQEAATVPGDPIEIGDDSDNNGWSQDHQECKNDPDD